MAFFEGNRPTKKRKTGRSRHNKSTKQAGPSSLMIFPNETLLQISGFLDEPDLWALSQVNRRLAVLACRPLREKLYANPRRCKEVLLWAVEVGRHDVLQDLLERKTSPNFFYKSRLLRSRLTDVLTAQGRLGKLTPREDHTLLTEMFREGFCRASRVRRTLQDLRQKRLVPMEQDVDWNLGTHTSWKWWYYGVLNDFGIVEDTENRDTREFWAWTPLHVAVQRKDETAIQLLLQHGADLEARSSGVCDCAAPNLIPIKDPNDSVTPYRSRSVWTPLHVAMCSGHEQTAKLLISAGAYWMVGALTQRPKPLSRKQRLNISAFQCAAWMGSANMYRLLVDSERLGPLRIFGNARGETALHFAAAAGHVRTVGKVILQSGGRVSTHHQEDSSPDFLPPSLINDPVRLLCMQFRYADARWLLNFCQPLSEFATGGSPIQHYSRMLAALCFLRPPAVYNKRSLREQQDHLYDLMPPGKSAPTADQLADKAIKASRPKRVALATTLLALGASPNRAEYTHSGTMPINDWPRDWLRPDKYRTPLQLAASCGFTEMVKLLLSHGAQCDLIGDRKKVTAELPLFLAVKCALSPDGDSETVQALLDAGASLADRDGKSMLSHLYNFRPRKNALASANQDWTDWDDWLRIVGLFLAHGAADITSPENWEAVLAQACRPNNLQYCELLEKARPIRGLAPQKLEQMVVRAVRGCWDGQHAEGFTQDTEMVRWTLRHCVDARSRSLLPDDWIYVWIQHSYAHNMPLITEVLREFRVKVQQAADKKQKASGAGK